MDNKPLPLLALNPDTTDPAAAVGAALDLRAPVITWLRQGLATAWLRVAVLVVSDGGLLTLAWWLALHWGTSIDAGPGDRQTLLLPELVLALGLLAGSGLYSSDHRHRLPSLVGALSLAWGILLLLGFLYQPGLILLSRSAFLLGWLLSVVLIVAGRGLLARVVSLMRRQGAARWPIYLLGTAEETRSARQLLQGLECFRILGAADVPGDRQAWAALLAQIRQLGVGEVFVCSWAAISDPLILYWNLKTVGINLRILPLGLTLPQQPLRVTMLGGLPTIQFIQPSIVGSDFWVKRAFDILVAGLLLIATAPLFVLIALAIRLDSSGPVFFRQTRIGLKGQPFAVWKFRTMVADADRKQQELEAHNEMKDGVLFKLKDDPRITRVGGFLRRYSLDELPQIFNVLGGQMSLVGPRPFPLRDVERFAAHHFVRQEVLPGITGLWQVSGRSNIVDFADVMQLDVKYIQNWSLSLDFKILLQTVKVVLRREGAY